MTLSTSHSAVPTTTSTQEHICRIEQPVKIIIGGPAQQGMFIGAVFMSAIWLAVIAGKLSR